MDRTIRWAQIVSALIGVADSIYLLVLKYSHNQALCLGSGDCATVNTSRFSEVNDIPVAAIGLLGYLAILAILAFENQLGPMKEQAGMLVFGMSLTGVFFSVYLTYLELYVIHAICPFCVISAVAILVIFVLSTVRLFKSTR